MSLPPAELEQLVADELRAPVNALVRRLIPQLVAEALNGTAATIPLEGHRTGPTGTGAADATASIPHQNGAETKACSVCGETKPADQYERGRRQCRACRRAGERRRATARRTAPADEEPHPAPTVTTGRRSQHRLNSDRFWIEHRRQLIEKARHNGTTTELRDGKVYTVLHLEPQHGLPVAPA